MSETTETTMSQEEYRSNLKIKALLDKVNEQEERIADLRVDLTLHAQEVEAQIKSRQELTAEVNSLRSELEKYTKDDSVQEEEK